NLEGFHVDYRADPGPRETTSGGDRRNHFARLCVLGRHDPTEWGPDDGVVHLLQPRGDVLLTNQHLRFLLAEPGFEGQQLRLGGVEIRLPRYLLIEQIRLAL